MIAQHYSPGWLMLASLLTGTLIGWLIEPANAFPVAMAAGLALGVSINSLLNQRINGPFDDPVQHDV